MLLGAHVGIGGGFENAVTSGLSIKADAIQIFTRNQMQWKAKPIEQSDAEQFRTVYGESGLKSIVAHGSYLINLASPEDRLRRISIEAAVDEMTRCGQLGVQTYIFHPGSHMGSGDEKGENTEVESLREVLRQTEGSDVRMALETMAGQGNVICHSFESIARILDAVDSPRLGTCIDSCHIFAAGYDIRNVKGLNATMKKFRDTIGMKRLLAFHLNESRADLGKRLDRHENIGRGKIGIEGFRALMHYRGLSRVPMILETPGGEKAYRKEISTLRKL